MSPDALAAIAARHHLPVEAVRPIPSGVANHAYLLGEDLVLRVPRATAFIADLLKEAVVIPAARKVGACTPNVITFDESCSEVEFPYLVLERVPGVDLEQLQLSALEVDPGRIGSGQRTANDVFHDVGRELAKVHRLSEATAVELVGIPTDDNPVDPRRLITHLRVAGHIDFEASRWLGDWFTRLSARIPKDPANVLVHGDIAPQNLLVDPGTGRLTGIVDWGDAVWADPAVEFAKTPLVGIPSMLDGYRQEADKEPGAELWEARVLWYHLLWALNRLKDPVPQPGERHWTAPPASRLLGILRFFASSPPWPWPALA